VRSSTRRDDRRDETPGHGAADRPGPAPGRAGRPGHAPEHDADSAWLLDNDTITSRDCLFAGTLLDESSRADA
jgi:hypothetical protein